MKRKTVSGIMLSLLLIGMLTLVFKTPAAMAEEPISSRIDNPNPLTGNSTLIWTVSPIDFGTLYVKPGQSVDLVVTISNDPSSDTTWDWDYMFFGWWWPAYGDFDWGYPIPPEIDPGNSWTGIGGTFTVFSTTPLGTQVTREVCRLEIHCSISGAQPEYYRIPITVIAGGYTLTINSLPGGVTFTVDNVSRTTPWSGTYGENTSVSFVMPEIHTVGDVRYSWNQWSDGNTSRTRTVTMDTDITLTAQYTILDYQLTVTSSPMTGIPFTIDGVPQTTPYTEWLLEGSYTLIMPETHNGYVWSHWLEDGDTNRIKTILLQGTTWTAVYEPAPKPVGGKATPINVPTNKPETPAIWIWLSTIILSLAVTVAYVKKRKRNTEINS